MGERWSDRIDPLLVPVEQIRVTVLHLYLLRKNSATYFVGDADGSSLWGSAGDTYRIMRRVYVQNTLESFRTLCVLLSLVCTCIVLVLAQRCTSTINTCTSRSTTANNNGNLSVVLRQPMQLEVQDFFRPTIAQCGGKCVTPIIRYPIAHLNNNNSRLVNDVAIGSNGR